MKIYKHNKTELYRNKNGIENSIKDFKVYQWFIKKIGFKIVSNNHIDHFRFRNNYFRFLSDDPCDHKWLLSRNLEKTREMLNYHSGYGPVMCMFDGQILTSSGSLLVPFLE